MFTRHGRPERAKNQQRNGFLIGLASLVDVTGSSTRARLRAALGNPGGRNDLEGFARDRRAIAGDWDRAVTCVVPRD